MKYLITNKKPWSIDLEIGINLGIFSCHEDDVGLIIKDTLQGLLMVQIERAVWLVVKK